MGSTWIEGQNTTDDEIRLFTQEKTIVEVTEMICALMQQMGVTKSELASRLGKTKGFVSQLLDGESNMTLRTVSDVLFAMGKELRTGVDNVASGSPVQWRVSTVQSGPSHEQAFLNLEGAGFWQHANTPHRSALQISQLAG